MFVGGFLVIADLWEAASGRPYGLLRFEGRKITRLAGGRETGLSRGDIMNFQ